MKWLKFNTKDIYTEVDEEGNRVEREVITPLMVEDNESGRAYAGEMSYDGVITEYDDGEPDLAAVPTQLDTIEAQVTYTAMMTDTLLEV